MPNHARCVVGPCDNDKRYPERFIKHRNVERDLVFHKLPADESVKRSWIQQVSKGRDDFVPPTNFFVCSNHFVDGKPTKINPIPTLFLTISGNIARTPPKRKPPTKRLALTNEKQPLSSTPVSFPVTSSDNNSSFFSNFQPIMLDKLTNTTCFYEAAVPMQFTQITRESDVIFFTGLSGTQMFRVIFIFKKKSFCYALLGWKQTFFTTQDREFNC